MKPSWAVTKFTEAQVWRPEGAKISREPVIAWASFGSWPGSPRQKARMVSRNWSFQSDQPIGKPPTRGSSASRAATARWPGLGRPSQFEAAPERG